MSLIWIRHCVSPQALRYSTPGRHFLKFWICPWAFRRVGEYDTVLCSTKIAQTARVPAPTPWKVHYLLRAVFIFIIARAASMCVVWCIVVGRCHTDRHTSRRPINVVHQRQRSAGRRCAKWREIASRGGCADCGVIRLRNLIRTAGPDTD